MLTHGSLFTGYGGLDQAVEAVFGARTIWVSDIEQFDKKGHKIGNTPLILAHRYPDVPNLGDITKVDWYQVPQVHIISGGSPCQDISTAGALAGMVEGTRSNLWVVMREAIRILRPAYVVWENVRGALSAKAASRMESDLRLLGDHPAGVPALRALGRVLGDLAELGFDAEWVGLPASGVGAPHGRWREFVVAAHPERVARLERRQPAPEQAFRGGHSVQLHDVLEHLAPADAAHNGPIRAGSAWGGRPGPADGGHAAMSLLPTPTTRDSKGHSQRHDTTCLTGERRGGARGGELLLKGIARHEQFGKYAPAIARWEAIFAHPAPSPTEPGKHGNLRLSARFAEWMMGITPGWVTGVPGLTRNQQLHAIGNGVCPQQAAEALQVCLARLADGPGAA